MIADLVLEGRVFRGLAGGFAEAVAVKDGHILAVGSSDQVANVIGAGTRRIALGGRVAIPPSTRRICTCWPMASASPR
ncbi:hypothetical protein ACFQY5_02915 [Paeniroseomonas aquatica]|uniref:hypothetical protein n=1 Tax=Paeniroseomonas aquatica TaxID=373043 RepID=UPI0036134A12